MVSVLVVSPVGTSLFRNFSSSPRFKSVSDRYGVYSWASLPLGDPANEYPGGEVCRRMESGELVSSLLDFVSEDPASSCAELSGYYAIYEDVRARYWVVERAVASLYPTASCTSYVASEVVARHLRSRGVEVVVRVVEAIRSEGEFDSGLASLMDAFAEDVADYGRKGFRVYVNATPGFKPEAAFLAVSAMLLGTGAVYYVHEAFRRAVRLPGVPVSIRREYLGILRNLVDTGGLELHYAYGVLGLTEEYVKDLEDKYLAYVEDGILKPRKWVVRLLERLEYKRG